MNKPLSGRVKFTDIQVFPNGYAGRSYDHLMSRMHARYPDGRWIEGVEVFRALYQEVGLGWWVPLSRLPGISHLLGYIYEAFARNRLRLFGRCSSSACQLPQDTTK